MLLAVAQSCLISAILVMQGTCFQWNMDKASRLSLRHPRTTSGLEPSAKLGHLNQNQEQNKASAPLSEYADILNLLDSKTPPVLTQATEANKCGSPGSNRLRFYCPTPSRSTSANREWTCISADQLCNAVPDCPNAEDEEPTQCMFYLTIQHQKANLRRWWLKQMETMKSKA